MILTKGLRRVPVYRYHAEKLVYRDAIQVDSAISERALQFVDKFVRDCKESGVWPKLLEVAPLAGNDYVAAMVKLKWQTNQLMTAVNFVIGDYSQATGLTGDAATKYVNVNFNASLIGATSHLAFYQRTDNASSSPRLCLGATDGVDEFSLGSGNPNVQVDGRLGKAVVATAAGQMTRGFYYAERKSTTDLKVYRNNTQIGASVTSTVHAAPNLNVFAWARNNSGTPAGYNHMAGSFLSIGADLTSQERSDYYAAVQTLQTNLGRAV